MTGRSRHLGGVNSPPPPTTQSRDSPPPEETLDSDFVVILAALLCALICVLGLVAVARCAWIRRISGRSSTQNMTDAPSRSAANKGLKKKVLKTLPKLTYGEDKEQTEKLSECAICLAEFASGEEIRVLPQCGHGFHVACIDTWLGSHSSCPSCRQILVVARCQKCGSLPAAPTSGGGGAQPQPSDSHVNSEQDQYWILNCLSQDSISRLICSQNVSHYRKTKSSKSPCLVTGLHNQTRRSEYLVLST